MGAGVSVHCFENYAALQRPLQPLLKALERLDWASFGLIVQAGFPPYLHEEAGSGRLLPADLIPSFIVLPKQKPQLKALERVDWASFGFTVQAGSPILGVHTTELLLCGLLVLPAVLLNPAEADQQPRQTDAVDLQAIVTTGVGTARLSFAPGSDDTWRLMKALVIHLVPPAALLVSPSKQKKRSPGPSHHLEVHLLLKKILFGGCKRMGRPATPHLC